MLKQKSIKSIIFSCIGILLAGIMVFQVFFYSLLRNKSNENIYLIFDSLAQNTSMQLEELNKNVADITFSLSINSTIQSAIYIHSPQDHVKNLNVLQNIVNDYKARDQNIVFLSIINKGKPFFSSEDVPLYDTIRDIVKNLQGQDITKTHYEASFFYKDKSYFACITPIFPTNINYLSANSHDNYVIALYTIPIENYMLHNYINSNNNTDDLVEFFITDSNNNILLSSYSDKNGTKFDYINASKKQFCKTLPLKDTNWFLTIKTLPQNISSLNSISTLFFMLMCFLYIIVLAIIFKLLNNVIVKRIAMFKKSVLQINNSDETYRIKYQYEDELNEIASVINQVLDRLHTSNQEHIKTLVKLHDAELMQKETQIFYLEGQLSPHFLYNSMSYIQGVALKYNVNEIVEITISMSKVFRYISNNQSISTIRKDLDYAIDYFNVINIRRQFPINLINKIENEDILSIPCLKNIFQPILENILKHAFDLNSTGTVTISAMTNDDKIIVEITDDGNGVSEETLAKINHNIENFKLGKDHVQTNIGILNVHTRLKLYYSNDSGLHIITTPGKGTKIRIVFDKNIPTHNTDVNFL